MRQLASVDDLNYLEHLRPGDRLLWGQACGEPRTLVEHLLAGPVPEGLSAFVGIDVQGTIGTGQSGRISYRSYIGSGVNSALHAAGQLDIVPSHYSGLSDLVCDERTGVDVVLVRAAPPGPDGRVSLGTNADYLAPAVRHARLVIAELDPTTPYTYGDAEVDNSDIDLWVPAQSGPVEFHAPTAGPKQERIAQHVTGLVDDGATLQIGVGSLGEAVLAALGDHRHLGVHTGQLPDGIVDLIERGAVTNERKTLDRGVTVGGMLLGTRRLFDFVHRNPRVSMRTAEYTHGHAVLAQLPQLAAVNSAIEVDLTGQINSEVARGRYVGGVGGIVDFLRGAAASPGGLPIVTLASTAGPASRIVSTLSGPVSVARSDAAIVVTEHGIADLRGLSLTQRAEALIAIAAPEHRAALSEQADTVLAATRADPTRNQLENR